MNDSTRFFVMSGLNYFVCRQATKRLSKDGKKLLLSKYLKFIVFIICLLGINQIVFFMFQPNNLYDQLQISRNMPISQIKIHSEDIKIKIMTQQHLQMKQKMQALKKLDQIVSILTHPARRLSYDTFGQTSTQYAWAFKNQGFLLSSIIGSGFFYIICIFMNMMSKNKDQMKQALKLQIMFIFLVFIWQVQTIMQTQSRFNQPTDFLDKFYTSLPVFERRQLSKVLLFPFTNVLQFFLRYYVPNQSQKKLLDIAKHPKLREITAKVRAQLGKVQKDEHLEDRVQVGIAKLKQIQPIPSDIYLLQRQVLRSILILQNQNILVDQQILQQLLYFLLIQNQSVAPK